MSATPPEDDAPEDDAPEDSPDNPQDGEQPPDGSENDQSEETTGTVGTSSRYAVADSVGNEKQSLKSDSTMQIGDTVVPGIYDIVESGAGRKSQYLKETQPNGGGSQQSRLEDNYGADPSNLPDDGSGEGQTDGETDTGSSGGGTETPPLTVKAKAYVGASTYAELDSLRKTPAEESLFDVELGSISLEDCELVKLTRSLKGGQPTVYDCTIEVREYREYEVIDNRSSGNYGIGGGGGGGGGGSGDVTTPANGEFANEVRQWVDRNNDGIGDRSGEPLPEVTSTGSINQSLGGGQAIENVVVNGNFSVTTSDEDGGWAIRNVGVSQPYNGPDSGEPVVLEGDGIVEHCYFGEGANSHDSGIFVHGHHTGTIIIRYCYFSGFRNNGIYGSDAGSNSYPNTGGGTVIVENCYIEGNGVANLRLGTTGSVARNSVIHNPTSYGNRTIWAYFETTQLVNCDLGGRIVVGEDAHEKGMDAKLVMNNCRWNGEGGTNVVGSGSIEGLEEARAGSPNFGIPNNVPTSPQEAAQGRFYSNPPGGA